MRTTFPRWNCFAENRRARRVPLVWAHSEYIKLRRSLRDGKIFDQPPQTVQRYQVEKQKAAYFEWRFNNKCRTMPQGKKLRMLLPAPAMVHWSFDGWQTAQDTPPATRSESSWQTCPPTLWRKDARLSSPSTGRRSSAGKA